MNAAADDARPRAGILVTGTEVLNGRIVDSNGPWLSERLAELGVEVAGIVVVGDRPGDIGGGLEFLVGAGCSLVVTSGGLGPTADDLTAEQVARFAGAPMVLDDGLAARIEAIVAGYAGRSEIDTEAMRAGARKQALVPRGAVAIEPVGTAPGLVVEASGGNVVVVLPGPPGELRAIWQRALAAPAVRRLLERALPFGVRTLRLFGVPESELARGLGEIGAEIDLGGLEITTCQRQGEIEIEVRYSPLDAGACERLAGALGERYARRLFSVDGASVDEIVAGLLAGRTVALAESSTAGMLAARLTRPAGASRYFAGGVAAYSDAAKAALLGVDPALLGARGAVSPEIAEAMARGALERFGADLACAITGIAGPGGGSERKPIGYTCIHTRDAAGRRIARDPVIPGDRAEVRERTTTLAMHMLRRLLEGEADRT